MTDTVTMGVNEDRLLTMLRNSFTNSTTFLGELLQNARRAGATRIDFMIEDGDTGAYLTVVDDGRGIQDWSGLVSICESGWDSETMTDDKPFGVGFLSALCAATAIDVVSNGTRMCCDTELLLSRQPTPLTAESLGIDGTSIGLSGIDISRASLCDALRRLARGFPLPVSCNGDALERPDALDAGAFIQCPIGAIAVSTSGHSPRYYLQGLPVRGPQYRTRHRRSLEGHVVEPEKGRVAFDYAHIIHLDSRRFNARLPDRDQLIDMADAAAAIGGTVPELMQGHARQMKAELDEVAFVARFNSTTLRRIGCLDLLNDIPVISYDVCTHVTLGHDAVLPANRDHIIRFGSRQETISKADIEAADLVISAEHYEDIAVRHCASVDIDDDRILPSVIYLAHFTTIVVDTAMLDDGHWIHSHLGHFDPAAVRYQATGHTVTESLQSSYCRFPATVCDAIDMDGPLGMVRVDRWLVPDPDSDAVMMPIDADPDGFQSFIEYWDGDRDQFDNDGFNATTGELLAQARAVHSGQLSQVVAATLRDSSIATLDTIRNKRFTVSFDATGALMVEEAA